MEFLCWIPIVGLLCLMVSGILDGYPDRRPDTIEPQSWEQLLGGLMCTVPMSMLGELVNLVGWELVGDPILASRWGALEAAR